MRGPQALPHPALVTDAHRVIDIAVIVEHDRCSRTYLVVRLRVRRGRLERHILTVADALAVDGVGPHVVRQAHIEVLHGVGERLCTRTQSDMEVVNGRVGVKAPAEAVLGNVCTAVGGDDAARYRRCQGDVGHGIGGYRRHSRPRRHRVRRDEIALLAVRGALLVDGVGPHIVVSFGIEVVQDTGKRCGVATVGFLVVVRRGSREGAPADTPLRHSTAAGVGHHAADFRRRTGNVRHLAGDDRGRLADGYRRGSLVVLQTSHGNGIPPLGDVRPSNPIHIMTEKDGRGDVFVMGFIVEEGGGHKHPVVANAILVQTPKSAGGAEVEARSVIGRGVVAGGALRRAGKPPKIGGKGRGDMPDVARRNRAAVLVQGCHV